MPEGQRGALKEYKNVEVKRRDVVQALRKELGLYVPVWSRYRRAMRETLKVEHFPLN